jgi:hypothetical protein
MFLDRETLRCGKLFEPADEYSVQRAYQVPQSMRRMSPGGGRCDGEDITIWDGGNGAIPVEICNAGKNLT